MAGKILDNGTLLALGLVGVVAAVGAANKAGLYGSRAMSGSIYTVKDGISSVTGEREILRGLRVREVGPGRMVGEVSVQLVDALPKVQKLLQARDPWWTLERTREMLSGEIEFDRSALQSAD